MIYYIDCDGVLFNLMQGIVDEFNRRHGTHWTHDQITAWNMQPMIPLDDAWWNYTDAPDFYEHLDIYPWAHELLAAVRGSGFPYAFLSSLPIKHINVLDNRRNCLDRHFKVSDDDPPSERLVVAKRKELVVHPGDVLIDDYPVNIEAVAKGGCVGWMLDQPWNRYCPGGMTPPEIIERIKRRGKW